MKDNVYVNREELMKLTKEQIIDFFELTLIDILSEE